MIIVRKRGFLKIAEIWFDQVIPQGLRIDVVERMQTSHLCDSTKTITFPTLLVDLSGEEDKIFAGIKKDTRYEIRRGIEKDHFLYTQADPIMALDAFCDAYDQFAAQKGLPVLHRARLRRYAEHSVLCITKVLTAEGDVLSWHVFYCASARVRLLHSISHFRYAQDSAARAFIGRAGRYHHWADICHFKKEGISLYDLGGWYDGTDDQERVKINKFKEEFGGRLVHEFNCEYAMSMLGRIFLRGRQYASQL